MGYARRHAKSAGYVSLATAAGILALGTYSSLRETPPDAIFLSVAHRRDLDPYKKGDKEIYNLGKSGIVAPNLSDVVYFIMAIDGDGIKNASLTFNGVEVRSANSDDPRSKGLEGYGVLDSRLADFEGDYILRFTVIDQENRLMVRSVVIELRRTQEESI